jgi:hypothetical protein
VLGHASEDETTESLAAVGRHNDQVGSPSFRRLKNLDARIANHDFDLVASFAIDFLASQALKLGSRGGRSSYRRAALPRVREALQLHEADGDWLWAPALVRSPLHFKRYTLCHSYRFSEGSYKES